VQGALFQLELAPERERLLGTLFQIARTRALRDVRDQDDRDTSIMGTNTGECEP
jgi:hypothetical protein